MKAISDSFGTPTYAPHMAARLRDLALLDIPGLYHMANAGPGTSYYGFARAILGQTGDVTEVSADSLQRPAPRPKSSRLRCLMQEALNLEPLPDWEEALVEFKSAFAASDTAAQ